MFAKLKILYVVMEAGKMNGMLASRGRWVATKGFIAVIISLALVLAACGNDSESAQGGSQGEVPEGFSEPEVTSLKIAQAALEPGQQFTQYAIDHGLFEKYGLTDVESIYFEGSGRALQAVVSGQVHILNDTPQATLISHTTENPLQDVASFTNRFIDCIYTTGSVQDPADVEGKRVAVSSLGGQSHAIILVALKELGLEIEEVELVQVGGESTRIAALQAGSVDVIPAQCALEDELTSGGFNTLLRMPDVEAQMPTTVVQVPREFIEANPNTVLAVVAAYLEAMDQLFEDPEAAAQSYVDWAQIDLETARTSLEAYREVAQRDLRWTKEGYLNTLDFLVLSNPVVAAVDVERAYSFEFVERLEELGLYDELGVP